MSERPQQVSIVSIITIALILIFAANYLITILSYILDGIKTAVSSTPSPQVAWVLAWYNYIYPVYSYLLSVLSNPYAIAVLVALSIVVLALNYIWYRQQ